MRRFHWRRKRAALALLPATVMLFSSSLFVTGLAAGQTTPTAAPPAEPGAVSSGGRADSAVKLRVDRHVMAGNAVKIRGEARPGGKRWVTVRVGGKKVRTVRTRKNGSFRVRWNAPRAGIYRAKAIVRGTDAGQAGPARAPGRSTPIAPRTRPTTDPACTGTAPRAARRSRPRRSASPTSRCRAAPRSRSAIADGPCDARVIDRGPFAGNREWDLTAALKAKLGFGTTGTVLSTR